MPERARSSARAPSMPRSGDAARSTPRARTRPAWVERLALCALLVAISASIGGLFHPFAAPDNDYASFEDVARALGAFTLPDSFKRGPVLPALMAAVAPAAGGIAPYLRAALLVNAAASLANVALVYAIGRRLGGPRVGGVSAVAFATSPQFLPMALEPLVEPTLGASVLASSYALVRGSRLAYAGAAVAALGRAETALLVPAILAARLGPAVWSARRLRAAGAPAELGLAAAALLPLALWAGLRARFDTGADTYAAMWAGMEYTIAPSYLERSIREPFMGWYRRGDVLRALVIAVPLFFGVRRLSRRSGWPAVALLGLWLVTAVAVVRFGADKARYVYTTSWIPLLAFTVGVERIMARGRAALASPSLPRPILISIVALLLFGWIARMEAGLRRLAETDMPPIGSGWPEAAVLVAGLGLVSTLVAAACLARPRIGKSAARRAGATLIALYLMTPLFLGGLHGAQRALEDTYYDNYESALAAEWLAENTGPGPGRKAVMLVPSHGTHVAGLEPERLIAFAELGIPLPEGGPDAGDPRAVDDRESSGGSVDGVSEGQGTGMGGAGAVGEAIGAAMDALGASYAVYTWRAPVSTPSSRYYHRYYRTDLADVFAAGDEVPGFELVATIELPDEIEAIEERLPVRIYRRISADR